MVTTESFPFEPLVVSTTPELVWYNIDDIIWLARDPKMDFLEVHWPKGLQPARKVDGAPCWCKADDDQVHSTWIHSPTCMELKALRHGLGWIDVTSGTMHKIVQLTPLTITASILCAQRCGFHGFITDGHWVSA